MVVWRKEKEDGTKICYKCYTLIVSIKPIDYILFWFSLLIRKFRIYKLTFDDTLGKFINYFSSITIYKTVSNVKLVALKTILITVWDLPYLDNLYNLKTCLLYTPDYSPLF